MSLPSSIDNPRVVYHSGRGRPMRGRLYDILDYFLDSGCQEDEQTELEHLRARVNYLQDLVLALLVLHHSGQNHRLLLDQLLQLFNRRYGGASLTHEEEPR